MQSTLFVMLGGAVGAALRYHTGLILTSSVSDRWPLATLTVNLIGALAMGVLAGLLMNRVVDESWRLFLGVGLLGGFTTFSAFSLEMWQLLERGHTLSALAYAAMSLFGTVALVALGIGLTRGFGT
jgi:fluoride exporter